MGARFEVEAIKEVLQAFYMDKAILLNAIEDDNCAFYEFPVDVFYNILKIIVYAT